MYNDAIFVMLQVISFIISCFFRSSYNIISDGSGYHNPLDRYFLIKWHKKILLKPGNWRDQTTIYQLIKSNFTYSL